MCGSTYGVANAAGSFEPVSVHRLLIFIDPPTLLRLKKMAKPRAISADLLAIHSLERVNSIESMSAT